MDVINEITTFTLTLSFTDENGDAFTPTSGTYRIDDMDSGAEIVGDTAFTPSASTHDIEITSAQNAMHDSTKQRESRLVTVELTYASSKKKTAQYVYLLKNLSGVS